MYIYMYTHTHTHTHTHTLIRPFIHHDVCLQNNVKKEKNVTNIRFNKYSTSLGKINTLT